MPNVVASSIVVMVGVKVALIKEADWKYCDSFPSWLEISKMFTDLN